MIGIAQRHQLRKVMTNRLLSRKDMIVDGQREERERGSDMLQPPKGAIDMEETQTLLDRCFLRLTSDVHNFFRREEEHVKCCESCQYSCTGMAHARYCPRSQRTGIHPLILGPSVLWPVDARRCRKKETVEVLRSTRRSSPPSQKAGLVLVVPGCSHLL